MNTGEVILYASLGAGVLLYFLARVFFLLTLHRCLSRVHPENRRMQPAMVWLDLIPCFNLVWGFIIVARVSESLADEFYDLRADRRGDDYGNGIGIGFMVCAVIAYVPYVGFPVALPALGLWIAYWVKVAEYSRRLRDLGGDDYDDLDDPPG